MKEQDEPLHPANKSLETNAVAYSCFRHRRTPRCLDDLGAKVNPWYTSSGTEPVFVSLVPASALTPPLVLISMRMPSKTTAITSNPTLNTIRPVDNQVDTPGRAGTERGA